MTRIAHISDLHFGLARLDLVDPLVEAINDARPDAIAVSGDLSHRARESQFRDACAMLERLEAPKLIVPGNHDIPLDRPITRLLSPFRNWKKNVSRDKAPMTTVDDVTLVGLNTASPRHWQTGRLGPGRIARACERLALSKGWRIVVAHHPFSHPPGMTKDLMRGAQTGLNMLSGSGADLLLTGHLHIWRVIPSSFSDGSTPLLEVQIGSCLSARERDEVNDFALIDLEDSHAKVTRMAASKGQKAFSAWSEHVVPRSDGQWGEPRSAAA